MRWVSCLMQFLCIKFLLQDFPHRSTKIAFQLFHNVKPMIEEIRYNGNEMIQFFADNFMRVLESVLPE